MKDLIERLEKAQGPDGELEVEIWLAVTPDATRRKWSYTHTATGRVCDVDETRDKFGHLISVPRYMESLDAALMLVPEGAEKSLSDLYGEARAEVGLNFHDGSYTGEHKGGSLAIALCIAALRARADGGKR